VPAVERDLWDRLVAGELNRVVLMGGGEMGVSMMTRHVPQTLGLRPLWWHSYNKVVSSGDDGRIAALAEELAAEERWITENLPVRWAQPFLVRADVLIHFDTVLDRHIGPNSRTAPSPLAIVKYGLRRLTRAIKPGRAARQDSGLTFDFTDVAPLPWNAPARSPLVQMAELDFPGKVIRVTTHDQIRQLKAVRAPR
jgi:hypothetical protein